MRIVHVANYNFKYLGARHYSLPIRINNGFIRNGHDVFWFSDRDIARASNPFGSRKFGVKPCNRKLIEVCKNFQPEILALCHADIISTATIAEIRQLLPGIAIFQYNIDSLFNADNIENILSKSSVVDRTFSTTAGGVLAKIGTDSAPASFIPNPVDMSIDTGRCFEQENLKNDIFFAGGNASWTEQNDIRFLGPPALLEQTDLVCSFHGLGLGENIWGQEYRSEVCDSRIGLSFSHRPRNVPGGDGGPLYLYSSDRIAQYFGNGLMVVSNKVFGLAELYGNDSLVEVEELDEFIELMRWFQANDGERMRIAKAGYLVNRNCFNEKLVSQYMIDATLGHKFKYDYRWPIDLYRS